MKKTKFYLFLLVPILALVLLYITIRSNDSVKLNLYPLNSGFFLDKQDYFSEYTIVKKSGETFQLIVSGVKELYIFNEGEGCIIKYKENSKEMFLYLSDKTEKTVITDHLNDLKDIVNPDEIVWKKPWHIVTLKTLNNWYKLISQIIQILIILLVLYLIMKLFNIKRFTTKSQDQGV